MPYPKILLKPIETSPLVYWIKADVAMNGPLDNSELALCLGSSKNYLIMKSSHSVPSDMPRLLKCIGDGNLWGKTLDCWACFRTRKGEMLDATKSNTQVMKTPVAPYTGTIPEFPGTLLGNSMMGVKGMSPPYGRRLFTPSTGGHLFVDACGNFETSLAGRGFDCYTFILSLMGVNVTEFKAACWTGELVAQCLNALLPTAPLMLNGTWSGLTPMFQGYSAGGLYLLWSSAKAFLVTGGGGKHQVIEFGASGLTVSPAAAWIPESPETIYQVRKILWPRPNVPQMVRRESCYP